MPELSTMEEPSQADVKPPTTTDAHHKAPIGLRTVAVYEFVKGLLVLVVGLGLLSLIHRDAQAAAEAVLRTLHLDPAWHYSRTFVEASAKLTPASIRLLALGLVFYAVVRFVETYGLWHERHWAEWFAVVSAAVYLPVEIYHFCRHPTLIRAGLFLFNLVIVLYLAWILVQNHRRKMLARKGL